VARAIIGGIIGSVDNTTKVTLLELIYGQEVVLPVEINLQSCRVARQRVISVVEYTDLVMDRIYETSECQFRALREIEREILKVVKANNKRNGNVVSGWDNKFGKWSLSLEGPYRVASIVPGNAYYIEILEGQKLDRALNGKYLKRCLPSVWQGM
jgi:hypothetical protein